MKKKNKKTNGKKISSSSSSLNRAASTDILDPLSPLLPIIHRLQQVFRVTSCVLTQLLYVSLSWSSCFCRAICGGPQEYITYELVLASGQAKAGRPARTYIQQLCEDTGCSPEDLPEAMNDREKWRERVRDIHASGTT